MSAAIRSTPRPAVASMGLGSALGTMDDGAQRSVAARRRAAAAWCRRAVYATSGLVFQDSLTQGEQTLADAGDAQAVLDLRRRWQASCRRRSSGSG